MGSAQITKRQKIVSTALACCFSILVTAVPVLAVTKPYFKTYGSDVFSGGWFNSGTSCDTSTDSKYQDPNYSDPASGFSRDDRTGGILSYAKKDGAGRSAGGASSQFGVFALGIIEGSDPELYGFYSVGAQALTAPTSRNLLTFANDGSTATVWGGKFDGSVRQSNCIPDYYSKLPSPAPPGLASLSSSTPSGVYTASAGGGTNYALNNSVVTLGLGIKITIYVDGNVFIGQNIVYQLDKVNNVPKFALVAKGNIYIDPGVTQLDGLYIAQPLSNSTTAGDIWTCHLNNTDPIHYTFPATACTNQLVINGALVAKQVNFMRVKGDVASASTSEDTPSEGIGNSNIAEVINYSPAMTIGGPFFNPTPTTGPKINSLIALPPVF